MNALILWELLLAILLTDISWSLVGFDAFGVDPVGIYKFFWNLPWMSVAARLLISD